MTVIPLTELDPADLDRIGVKAAGLGRLTAAGERVPAGFCLTTEAYEAGRTAVDGQERRAARNDDGENDSGRSWRADVSARRSRLLVSDVPSPLV